MNYYRKKAHSKTREDEYEEELVKEAEKKFLETIENVKDERVKAGKPLNYSILD